MKKKYMIIDVHKKNNPGHADKFVDGVKYYYINNVLYSKEDYYKEWNKKKSMSMKIKTIRDLLIVLGSAVITFITFISLYIILFII